MHGCPKEDTHDGVLGWNRLTKGFWGNILEEPPAGQEWNVMTDWTDLISILGRIIFSVQKVRSKVLAGPCADDAWLHARDTTHYVVSDIVFGST